MTISLELTSFYSKCLLDYQKTILQTNLQTNLTTIALYTPKLFSAL